MRILQLLRREREYLQDLDPDQRRLLFATVLYGFGAPIISTFLNTYLWRQSADPVVLIAFNIASHIGLAMGFFLNGFALRHVRATRLFFLGCLLQGLGPVLLVLSGGVIAPLVLPVGFLLGSASGIYWGNRNLFTLNLTTGPKRFKYLSVESSFALTASILSPVIIGWFLVAGERMGWYSIQSAYGITAVFGLGLLLFAGIAARKITHIPPAVTHIFITHPTPAWKRIRGLEFLSGLVNGFELILPIMMLLLFLNGEQSIGLVQSIATILSVVGMYSIGRYVRLKDHVKILGVWTLLSFLGKTFFAFWFSAIGALLFHAINGLTASFRWTSLAAILYETIDEEKEAGASKRYAYLTDRECFLDLGRVVGLVIFLGLYLADSYSALRYGFLFTILFQGFLLILAKKTIQNLSSEKAASP